LATIDTEHHLNVGSEPFAQTLLDRREENDYRAASVGTPQLERRQILRRVELVLLLVALVLALIVVRNALNAGPAAIVALRVP
jgi:hypothetical protein